MVWSGEEGRGVGELTKSVIKISLANIKTSRVYLQTLMAQ